MLDSKLNTLNAADRRVRAMAGTMYEMLATRGECTERLMLAEGFSRHELETYGDAARTEANALFVRRDDVEAIARAPLRTDEELLNIAADRCGGLVGEGDIVAQLRKAGFELDTIERIWDRLMPKVAHRLSVRLAKLPKPELAAA